MGRIRAPAGFEMLNLANAVVVTLTKQGAPESGILVVFGDAAGAVIATETTSETGVAAHVVPGGSHVTLVMGTLQFPRLVTITDVETGDLLTAPDTGKDIVAGGTVNARSYRSSPRSSLAA